MDQTLSAKYARATQQLERKKDEVDRLMVEAKALDEKNRQLSAENTQLKSRNLELETQAGKRNEEFKILETHVKKQQIRLQQFIENEANNTAAKATGRAQYEQEKKQLVSEHQRVVEELTKKVQVLHESRKSLQDAYAMSQQSAKILSEENEKLRAEARKFDEKQTELMKASSKRETELLDKIRGVEDELGKHDAARRHVDVESQNLADLDLKAKEALKTEFMALVAEVDRLQHALDDERQLTQDAKRECATMAEQMTSLRRHSDEATRIATAELEALTAQQDSILRDLKTVVKERDDARKKEAEADRARREEREVEEKHRNDVITAATAARPKVATKTREVQYNDRDAADAAGSTLRDVEKENDDLRGAIATLTSENEALREDLNHLQRAQKELMDNSQLREEREQLQAELREDVQFELQREKDLLENENRILQQQLEEAQLEVKRARGAPQTKTETSSAAKPPKSTRTSSDVPAAEVEDIDKAVHTLLVTATKLMHELPSSRDGDPNQSRSSSTASESGSLPTTRCDKYDNPAVNSVHRQLGGLAFCLNKLKLRIRRLLLKKQSAAAATPSGAKPDAAIAYAHSDGDESSAAESDHEAEISAIRSKTGYDALLAAQARLDASSSGRPVANTSAGSSRAFPPHPSPQPTASSSDLRSLLIASDALLQSVSRSGDRGANRSGSN